MSKKGKNLEKKFEILLNDDNGPKSPPLIQSVFFYLGLIMMILSLTNVINVSFLTCLVFMFLPSLIAISIITLILCIFGIISTLSSAFGLNK